MRSRHIGLACVLAGALGLGVLPSAARAAPLARPLLSISTHATTYPYKARVTLAVTLGTTYSNRTVRIYAAPAGHKAWLWKTGEVGSAGGLRLVFRLTTTTTFTVTFAGDARDAAASASVTVNALAGVADAISGYDRTTEVGRLTYDVFSGSDMLVLRATVWPDKHGECLKPETEQWDTGSGWDEDTSYGCDSLDSSSHDSAPFNLDRAAGDQYRIRADYVRSATDRANLSADGPWLYFMVVK